MTDQEFDQYVDECFEAMEAAQDEMETRYGIGHFDRWDLDQPTATLRFKSKQKALQCKVYAVGTLAGGAWKWAWANPSMPAAMAAKSEKLKTLKVPEDITIFGQERFGADDGMAWEFAAMALREIGGIGVYFCPAGKADLVVVIESIEMETPAH